MSRDTTWKPKKITFKLTPEQIKKRNDSRKRNNPDWFTPETIEKLRKAQTGKKDPKWLRKIKSDAQLRRWHGSDGLELRAKRAQRSRLTPEQKEARSYRMKIWWEKRKKKMAAAEKREAAKKGGDK